MRGTEIAFGRRGYGPQHGAEGIVCTTSAKRASARAHVDAAGCPGWSAVATAVRARAKTVEKSSKVLDGFRGANEFTLPIAM